MAELFTLIVIVLGAALIATRGLRWHIVLPSVIVAGGLATALYATAGSPQVDPAAAYLPADRTSSKGSRFASSRACRSCHPSEYASWRESFHRKMTQEATSESIIPVWEGELLHAGRTYRLVHEDGRYFVDMPKFGTDGVGLHNRMTRPIVMTTGAHHQQLFWFPLPWADEPANDEEEVAYQDLCARCHGEDARGGDSAGTQQVKLGKLKLTVAKLENASGLVDEDLTQGEVEQLLDDADHMSWMGLDSGDARLVHAVQHIVRRQLRDRLMQFPFSYMVQQERWVHEDYTFLQPPESLDELEPYDEGWSNACDQCHAVGARFDFDDYGELGNARVAELGISCESCHGAGAAHVAHYQNPIARYVAYGNDEAADEIVNPARLDPKRGSAVCGQCHGEHRQRGERLAPLGYRPGDLLEPSLHIIQYQEPPYPQWLAEELAGESDLLSAGFWRDGTVRVAGRDYNGLMKTACHTKGEMSCMTCHSMHDSDPDDQLHGAAETDAICTTCHASIAEDVTAHTHHEPTSPGSDCYNCHMPHTTIGLLKSIRAHRIDSPSAVVSATTGRPNACNLCHIDKTLQETAATLTEWYGQPPLDPAITGVGTRGPSAAIDWLLRGDAAQRAIAVWHLGWEPAWQASGAWWPAPFVAELLDDPYAAVRFMAGRSIEKLGFEGFDYVAPATSRQRFAADALGRWREDAPSNDAPWIRGGVLDRSKVQARKALRDDRPVSVSE